ncbi:MAG: MFS transporter [Sphingopyxis sp.]|nr:MFS transporter [Sphingopyxis sp.]
MGQSTMEIWRLPGSLLNGNQHPFIASIANAFHIPAFAIFFVANLLSYVLSGVQAALAIHLMTYYWCLPPQGIQWVLSAMTIGVLVGSMVVQPLSRKWDKKPLLVASVIASVAVATLPICLAETGWIATEDKARLTASLFGFLFLAGLCGGAALVLPGAILADLADAYEGRFGERVEGLIYGASAFTRKAALGFGGVIAGIVLDIIRFPRGVSAIDVDHAMAVKLALLYGPAMLALALVAMIIMWRYPLDRKQHDQILAALEQRRQMHRDSGYLKF